jgi:hypothetical protein
MESSLKLLGEASVCPGSMNWIEGSDRQQTHLLPAVENSPSERAGLYGKSDFRHDATRDVYHCPGGAVSSRRRQMTDQGKVMFNYDHPKACGPCPLKARCTLARDRTLSRWEQETGLERMAQKVATAPEKLAARKTLIEHCWGTAKGLLPGGFLVRGKVKVEAEVSLAHFGCNRKRALAVVGLEKLLVALRNFKPDRLARVRRRLRQRHLATRGGGSDGIASNRGASLDRKRKPHQDFFRSRMKMRGVFHTGSERGTPNHATLRSESIRQLH